jgi:hypothetical protein
MRAATRTALLTLGLCLVGCGINFAQERQPKHVRFTEYKPTKEGTERIRKALGARLGSTDRYVLDDSSDAELTVTLLCISAQELKGSSSDSYLCTFQFFYRPLDMKPLEDPLSDVAILTGTRDELVEEMFEKFVESTSDKALKASRAYMESLVDLFCDKPEHARVCRK